MAKKEEIIKKLIERVKELEEKTKDKDKTGIVEISEVPPSPHTDHFKIQVVYNPLNEDFTHTFDGRPFTIPARSKKEFPEFLAYHLAKHLSMKIAQMEQDGKISERIEAEAGENVTEEEKELRKKRTAEAVNFRRGQEIMNALLDGSFEGLRIEIEKKENQRRVELEKQRKEKEKLEAEIEKLKADMEKVKKEVSKKKK